LDEQQFHASCEALGEGLRSALKPAFRRRLRSKTRPAPPQQQAPHTMHLLNAPLPSAPPVAHLTELLHHHLCSSAGPDTPGTRVAAERMAAALIEGEAAAEAAEEARAPEAAASELPTAAEQEPAVAEAKEPPAPPATPSSARQVPCVQQAASASEGERDACAATASPTTTEDTKQMDAAAEVPGESCATSGGEERRWFEWLSRPTCELAIATPTPPLSVELPLCVQDTPR
jgi:hypothetical protein